MMTMYRIACGDEELNAPARMCPNIRLFQALSRAGADSRASREGWTKGSSPRSGAVVDICPSHSLQRFNQGAREFRS